MGMRVQLLWNFFNYFLLNEIFENISTFIDSGSRYNKRHEDSGRPYFYCLLNKHYKKCWKEFFSGSYRLSHSLQFIAYHCPAWWTSCFLLLRMSSPRSSSVILLPIFCDFKVINIFIRCTTKSSLWPSDWINLCWCWLKFSFLYKSSIFKWLKMVLHTIL